MKRTRRGFTLVEMIIATLILGLAVVGAMTAINFATRSSGYAEQIQTATLLAQQQLGDAEQHSDTLSGGDSEGDFDQSNSSYHWKQSVETTDYQNLFKVTVTVQWGEKNSPHERSLTTYIRSDQNQQGQTGSSGTTGASGSTTRPGGG